VTTLSTRLGLLKHTTADAFHVADYTTNWNLLDASPGEFICTSSTRPSTWGAAQEGMRIYETDTKLVWRWDGAAFERLEPKGFLGRNSSTASINTMATTFQTAIAQDIDVPEGGRWVGVFVVAPSVTSTASFTKLGIFRDSTQLQTWTNKGGVGATVQDQDEPSALHVFDHPPAGTYSYSLKYHADAGYGGTSTIAPAANQPLEIVVIEF